MKSGSRARGNRLGHQSEFLEQQLRGQMAGVGV
jgi:hypothetical protein